MPGSETWWNVSTICGALKHSDVGRSENLHGPRGVLTATLRGCMAPVQAALSGERKSTAATILHLFYSKLQIFFPKNLPSIFHLPLPLMTFVNCPLLPVFLHLWNSFSKIHSASIKKDLIFVCICTQSIPHRISGSSLLLKWPFWLSGFRFSIYNLPGVTFYCGLPYFVFIYSVL